MKSYTSSLPEIPFALGTFVITSLVFTTLVGLEGAKNTSTREIPDDMEVSSTTCKRPS